MQTTTQKAGAGPRRAGRASPSSRANLLHAAVFESAKEVGLLQGERTRHVSFRAPPALVEAAMRETGVTSASELGILALAALAQPDPVSAFMRQTKGRLGRDHKLDY
ncbi:hypothetical protein [Rhodopila sp.]|uniref:hypothetical protein n=1 Tax=Rhodopila sp. TaxID=2480087 RepID=UPI003D143F9D